MTDQEIEKLREKLGSDYSVKRQNGAITVELVDIWKGVEFAECVEYHKGSRTGKEIFKGQIYRITDWFKRELVYFDGFEYGWPVLFFKPSTEAAYVEQLKAKAHELYGEIKDGDRFDASELGYKGINIVDFMPEKGYKEGFDYQKQGDRLYYSNVLIYQQGIWAKKVDEPIRVKVELMQTDSLCRTVLRFSSNRAVEIKDKWEFFNHIEEAIESYLNKQ